MNRMENLKLRIAVATDFLSPINEQNETTLEIVRVHTADDHSCELANNRNTRNRSITLKYVRIKISSNTKENDNLNLSTFQ